MRALVVASLLIAATAAASPPPLPPPVPAEPPPPRDRVRAALAVQRTKHLAALRAYRKHGVFAHASDREEQIVWRDADGHLDAPAAMMAAEGKTQAEEVAAAAPQMDSVRLVDTGDVGVHLWEITSGFAPDELDKLQRPHLRPIVVRAGDTSWQAAEDLRLARAYAAVEAYLRGHTDDGLDAAADALMRDPISAWVLVDPKHVPAPTLEPEPDKLR